jgi:two-component system response regulator DesR
VGRTVIRILLGFHGALPRAALSELLAAQVDLTVVAELGRGEDVLPAAQRERPHVAVLDHALPGSVDIEALCAQLPDCRVLALLDGRSSGRVGRALARLAPQVGLISVDAPPHEFVDAVRRIARGEPVLDAGVAMVALHSRDCVLTGRERDVLRLAAIGATAKEIAMRLGLSPGTVRNYLSRTLTKLDARSRIEAIRIAQDAGWI